jgi:transcriptional activator HAC1
LMDATMAVLRLVSSEGYSVDRVSGADESAAAAASGESPQQLPRRGPTGWPNGASLPSKEVLLALLWVLRVEERRLEIREQVKASSKPGTSSVIPNTTTPAVNKTTYVLKVSHKRNREEESRVASLKKRRSH